MYNVQEDGLKKLILNLLRKGWIKKQRIFFLKNQRVPQAIISMREWPFNDKNNMHSVTYMTEKK